MSTPAVTTARTADADPPQITVKPDDSDGSGMAVLVTVDNHGNGAVILLWGQSPVLPSSTNPGDGTTPSRRRYTVGGTWTITAKPVKAGVPDGTAQVTVPWPTRNPAPTVLLHEDPSDPTGMSVVAVVDNHGNGPVRVDWGQPGLPIADSPGDATTPVAQRYQAAGTYTVTATDPAHLRTPAGTSDVTVPMKIAPVIGVRGAPDDVTGMQVLVTVDNHGQGAVVVDWGQDPALPTASNPGNGRTPTRGTYTRAGNWTVTAATADDEWAPPGAADVTVPVPVAPTVTAVEDPEVTSGMGVIVTVDSHGAGRVDIGWGQIPELPDATNAGDGQQQTRQTYTKPGTWTISATDADNQWAPTGSTYVTVPYAHQAARGPAAESETRPEGAA